MKHLVLTVHGIRTYGRWQERLESLLRAELRKSKSKIDLDVRHYRYGFFTLFTFILPFFRNLAVRRFRAHLNAALDDGPYARIDVVAHSFGSFLFVGALSDLGRSDEANIHTAILCGSVLPPERNLSQLVGINRPVGRIVNDCGIQDGVLLLTLPVYGVGMGGRLGLHGFEGSRLKNRFFKIGHSGYFEGDPENSNAFMQRWWLPLLLFEGSIEEHDERPIEPSWSDRTWRTLGENGAVFALSIYLLLVSGIIWALTSFWLTAADEREEAQRQRDNALKTSARLLSDMSERMVEVGDSDRAILLAMASLEVAPPNYRKTNGKILNQRLSSAVIASRNPVYLTATGNVYAFAKFSPDGKFLCSLDHSSEKHAIALHNGYANQYERRFLLGDQLEAHQAPVLGCVFSSDSKRFVTWANDGTARVWSTEHPEQNHVLDVKQHLSDDERFWSEDRMWGAAFSPDNKYVATFSANDTAIVWDSATGKRVGGPFLHGTWVVAGAFNEASDRLYTVSWHNKLRAWNLESSERESIGGPDVHSLAAASAFSRDVRHVAITGGEDNQDVYIWTVQPFRQILHLPGHTDNVVSIEFSPDNALVVTASSDHTARVWSVENGEEIALLKGHTGPVHSASFSSDGRFVVTSSMDQTARVWDVSDGTQTAILQGHFGPVHAATISRDNNWVATASTIQSFLYKIEKPNGDLLTHARKAVPRCLSANERIDLGLPKAPPDWCIEQQKTPYDTAAWKEWLQAKMAGQ